MQTIEQQGWKLEYRLNIRGTTSKLGPINVTYLIGKF